jgi:hypothetical protein
MGKSLEESLSIASAKFGVRRQTAALWISWHFDIHESKAVSHYACHRTPHVFFSSLPGKRFGKL